MLIKLFLSSKVRYVKDIQQKNILDVYTYIHPHTKLKLLTYIWNRLV